MAANTIARSACGAAAPLFTNQMFAKLGVGGGGSLIGGVAALLAPIPFIFYKYGKQIRIKSKFAPTDEKPADNKGKEGEKEGNEPESNDSESTIAGSPEREAGDDEEKQKQEGRNVDGHRASVAGSDSDSDESLELGADYETPEQMERRLQHQRRRPEMERVATEKDTAI